MCFIPLIQDVMLASGLWFAVDITFLRGCYRCTCVMNVHPSPKNKKNHAMPCHAMPCQARPHASGLSCYPFFFFVWVTEEMFMLPFWQLPRQKGSALQRLFFKHGTDSDWQCCTVLFVFFFGRDGCSSHKCNDSNLKTM